MEDFGLNLTKILYTLVMLVVVSVLRFIVGKVINKAATKWQRLNTRTRQIKKMFNYLYSAVVFIFLLLIWGVDLDDFGLFLSSVFAILGIAFFAQWSILSNVTSGLVMFFTFPYKIGDFIKIYDGDNTVYGYIEDIRAFQVIIKNFDGEIVAYPNSMLLQKGVAILNQQHVERLKREKQTAKTEG